MAKRGWAGLALVTAALVGTQLGVAAEDASTQLGNGPSQGHIPANFLLAQGGGGGGASEGGSASARPVSPAPTGSPSPAASPSPQGGGGGPASNIVPVAPQDPHGIDAVADPSPAPQGGGGGPAPIDTSPFIRVLPGGDAADWTRSPSPSPPGP